MFGYLIGGTLSGAYYAPKGIQHSPDRCCVCSHAQDEARNRNIDALRRLSELQRNDPRLAEQWRRFRANEVTGVVFDDTQ